MTDDYKVPGLPMRTPAGRIFTYAEAMENLAAAMERLPTYVTPQTASGIQATENFWRRIEVDGLLTGGEVAKILQLKPSNIVTITRYRETGQLIGVRRRGRHMYPSFQFDLASHQVLPVIRPLIEIASEYDYSHVDLLFWLYNETTYFEDERRPVDHLEPADALLEVARNAMAVEW